MARLNYKSKSLIGQVIAIAVLAALLAIIAILSNFPTVCEAITVNFNQYVATGIGYLTSWLPFSVFEFFIIFCIIFVLICLILAIVQLCKRRPLRALKSILIIIIMALTVGVSYSMLATFPYHRATIPLPYSDKLYEAGDVENLIDSFVSDFNALGEQLGHDSGTGYINRARSYNNISSAIAEEYKRLDKYNYYYKYTPKAKSLLNNWVMNESRILGIAFLPTGEAHYNKSAPPTEITSTIAHELAHTKGVMREGDANMTTYYLLLTSNDPYLRYCGYMDTFWLVHNMWRLHNPQGKELTERPFNRLSEAIKADMNASDAYWSNIDSVFDKISSFFNNLYLKLNGANNGSGSYWDKGDNDVNIGEDGSIEIVVRYSRTEKMLMHIYEQRFN